MAVMVQPNSFVCRKGQVDIGFFKEAEKADTCFVW